MTDRRERVSERDPVPGATVRPLPSSANRPPGLLGLQSEAGNRTVVQLLAVAQAKLTVGAVDDPLEIQADRMADGVVREVREGMPVSWPEEGSPVGSAVALGPLRSPSSVGLAGGEVDADLERAIASTRGGGRPLPDAVREQMEGAFSADLGSVRLHSGQAPEAMSERLQAEAFTVGADIFLRGPVPDATSESGLHLLAHELSHVVQQGAVQQSSRPGIRRGIANAELQRDGSSPGVELEAKRGSADLTSQSPDDVIRRKKSQFVSKEVDQTPRLKEEIMEHFTDEPSPQFAELWQREPLSIIDKQQAKGGRPHQSNALLAGADYKRPDNPARGIRTRINRNPRGRTTGKQHWIILRGGEAIQIGQGGGRWDRREGGQSRSARSVDYGTDNRPQGG